MSKQVLSFKEVTAKIPAEVQYMCDTCGYVFKKGERKVTYFSSGKNLHACYDKPCSAFSNPKGYEYEWDSDVQEYKWVVAPKEGNSK